MTGTNPRNDRQLSPRAQKMKQAIRDGNASIPPIAKTLNFDLIDIEWGMAVFEGTPTGDFLNPFGTVHGGWTAAILDSALGCAVDMSLTEEEAFTTVEFKVNCTRAITPETGVVTCTGKLISRGRRIATSEARLVDGNGKLLAHGTETCMIFPTQ